MDEESLRVKKEESVGDEVNGLEMSLLWLGRCVYLIMKHDAKGGGEAEKKCDSFDGRMDIGQ